jgi:hypothetical protein
MMILPNKIIYPSLAGQPSTGAPPDTLPWHSLPVAAP